MRILMVGKNARSSYSGGRFHAWLMAEAMAAAGHDVTYLTTAVPPFADEAAPGFGRVRYAVGRLATLPRERFDIIVVVPNPRRRRLLNDDQWFFLRVRRRARRDDARVVFLSFESPNWIEEVLGVRRDPAEFVYWGKYAGISDVILSSTREGDRYARSYYNAFNPGLRYEHCAPGINSPVCDGIGAPDRENRIVLLARFSDGHKNSDQLLTIIDESLGGFTIEIVVGVGGAPADFVADADARAAAAGLKLEWRYRISEAEKFAAMKRAKLLVFPSLFEGFGLPPVEAQYCGARVVAFDLPVLRELHGDREHGMSLVPTGDYVALRRETVRLAAEPYSSEQVSAGVSALARFDSYASRLSDVLSDVTAGIPQGGPATG